MKEPTYKMCIVNLDTNEIVITGGMSAAARHVGMKRDTMKTLFLDTNMLRQKINGYNYVIYKAEYYIKKS